MILVLRSSPIVILETLDKHADAHTPGHTRKDETLLVKVLFSNRIECMTANEQSNVTRHWGKHKRTSLFVFLAFKKTIPEVEPFHQLNIISQTFRKHASHHFSTKQVLHVWRWRSTGFERYCISHCLSVVFVQLSTHQDTQKKHFKLHFSLLATCGEFSLSSISWCTLTRQFSVMSQNCSC